MPAPDSIRQLVQHFEEQRAMFHAEKYKETQVRSDFLDPFFEALGWDVANANGYAEKYREVIQEASVEVGGQAKAADYAFRIGDKTLFLLEAKKPTVTIETHPEPAFQVRELRIALPDGGRLLVGFFDCFRRIHFAVSFGMER